MRTSTPNEMKSVADGCVQSERNEAEDTVDYTGMSCTFGKIKIKTSQRTHPLVGATIIVMVAPPPPDPPDPAVVLDGGEVYWAGGVPYELTHSRRARYD